MSLDKSKKISRGMFILLNPAVLFIYPYNVGQISFYRLSDILNLDQVRYATFINPSRPIHF